ncbi:hypothetical protein FXN58_11135 [Aggregatibacter actinomycetemcomitans]|uniref:hypothetical protein n=1 Tax=Aggregatibacter actinomycetemcomitans TaxID=714 RepID=UPI00077E4DD8|nr:hypothetical protein [Aggregatibacter actinomycetemcomitans]QEH46017.1 hypothetical protein FXN58_11135 [Aggregatibacter actinomycetemcomitans]
MTALPFNFGILIFIPAGTVFPSGSVIQLQAISLRMQKDILENLEFIAKYHGIGYQPLIKQILKRFVDQKLMKF